MSYEPIVSVIVPTLNAAPTLEVCLRSICSQTYPHIEIIVVDNHSRDDTIQIASRVADRVIVHGDERSEQFNAGMKVAQGEFVYRVDADFTLEPDVVGQAIQAVQDSLLDAVLIHNRSDGSRSTWAHARFLERETYKGSERNVATRFVRKDLLVQVGGLDENLLAGEDYDLHDRLVTAGAKLGWIDACEVHLGEPATLREVFIKHYRYGKTLRQYIAKDPAQAIRRISPFRRTLFQQSGPLRQSPKDALIFLVYMVVKHVAAGLGLLSQTGRDRRK